MNARIRIASWLAREQQIPLDDALWQVDYFVNDDEIVSAAVEWMESGKAPENPRIAEMTPATLAEWYIPMVALGLLYALRHEPQTAEYALKHAHPSWIRKGILADLQTGAS